MPTNILMPALSPTMEKGNLAKWLKKEGDKIKSGDVIAEIETDKATMEYEAVDDGTLAKIVIPEGTQDVAVNSVIAVLANEGEDVKAAASASVKAPAASKAEEPKKPDTKQSAPTAQTPATPRAPAAAAQKVGSVRPVGANRIFASPLARRLAKEANLDLNSVQGSGPHGWCGSDRVDPGLRGRNESRNHRRRIDAHDFPASDLVGDDEGSGARCLRSRAEHLIGGYLTYLRQSAPATLE